MGEDKLTRFERIRLEALSQAMASIGVPLDQTQMQEWETHGRPIITETFLFAKAERIEHWLKQADLQDMKEKN